MKKSYRSISVAIVALFLSIASINAQQLHHVLNEALVKLKPGTNLENLEARLANFEGQSTQFEVVRLISKKLNIYQVRFDNNAVNEYDFRTKIGRHKDVEVVQVNHVLSKRETTPNDPSFATQWQWDNVAAELAWDTSTGGVTANGDEIVVAIFDDGGDLDHPDLIDNNWVNPYEIPNNNIDDDNNGYVDDVNGWNFAANNNNVDGGGHGVSVAGMVGAVGNNDIGGVGMNWDVKLMNMRTGGIQESQVIEFYSYALDMRERYNDTNGAEGAFVVATNSSWGIDGGDPNSAPLWCGFYDTMGEEGILSCGATANNNVNVDVVGDLPTACPSEYMIAVTATDDNDNRTFSAYGATTIDVGAPGDNIYTTSQGGGYTFTSGTSFASPLTAGVVALMYSAPCSNLANLAMDDPALAAQMVRDYIFEGSEDVGNLPGDIVHGRVNAANSIQMIMDNCGPCPAPSAVAATDVIDVSANITWNSTSSTISTNLRWREVGAATWNDVMGVTSPYTLTGLMACTEYEIQLEDFCMDNEQSGYTNSYVFATDGCCVNPEEFAVSGITLSDADASWNSVFAAESYNIRYREVGAATWNETNLTVTNFTMSNLAECTDYEVQIQTVCAAGPVDYSESILFTTNGCGACIDMTYCESTSDDVSEEWISNVSIGDIDNDTPDSPSAGYSDFTGTGNTTDLETYASYDISLTPTYAGTTYDEYFKVYIDYNHDGEFSEADEVAYDAGDVTQTTVNGTVTIPSDATIGLTRMRVIMSYNGPSTSCDVYDFGETEDYCVNIVEGTPTCDAPENLGSTAITETSATLTWDASIIAESYNVRYKAVAGASWTTDNVTATTYAATGLDDCTEYEFQVESVCAGGELSGYSDSHEFQTICVCGVPENLDSMNVTMTTAIVMWDAVANADEYDLRYKIVTSPSWDNLTIGATSIALANLTECSEYEFQVRASCANSESDYSGSAHFNTACLTSTQDLNAGVDQLAVYPNPFNDQIAVQFDLNAATDLQLALFDATGKALYQQNFSRLAAGNNTLTIKDMNGLGTGIYFVTLTTNQGTTIRKVIKQ